MLSIDPNIIFIDDKEDEVNGIIQAYRKNGYGVKFFNADLANGDDHPSKPYSDVNLVFLDLYYNNSYDLEICTGWISSIIPENSFYVLVIWSRDTQHNPEIIADLKKLNREPYSIISANKVEQYMKTDSTLDFERLEKTIKDELDKNSELEELALWKRSIKNSSNHIVGHLAKTPEILKKRLKKIIIGHGGNNFISNDNFDNKREILFEALDQILVSNSKGVRPEIEISEVNKTELYSIESNIKLDIDTKLNSWFHFNLHKAPLGQNKVKVGLISKFQNGHLEKHYKILDDKNVEKYLDVQIKKSNEDNSTTRLSNICMVLIRPCDVAQNKYGKNVKLLSGVLIENPVRGKKGFHSTIKKYDSLKLFDHLYFSEELSDLALLFDFRYVFSVSEKTFIEKFKNIKIFNKELLSEIQVEYSSYSSRLGITQII